MSAAHRLDTLRWPEGPWTRSDYQLALAAALKAFGGPVRAHDVRRAVSEMIRPAPAFPRMGGQWADAEGPDGPEIWGKVVRDMRARGHLVEGECGKAWAPGEGLDGYYTCGWPDARASIVVAHMRSLAADVAALKAIRAELEARRASATRCWSDG